MAIDWDTTIKMPRIDLRDRICRIEILSGNNDLRSRLIKALLDHTDHNVYITIGGLVILLNSTIGLYRSELAIPGQLSFQLLRPALYQQLSEALIDDPEIRRVVLESLYDTNGITRP